MALASAMPETNWTSDRLTKHIRHDGTSVAPDIADVAYEAMLKSAKVNMRFAPQAKRILP